MWLENKNIQLNQLSKKLDNKRYGVGLRSNLVLGNTRELDRELFYKLVYLLYYY